MNDVLKARIEGLEKQAGDFKELCGFTIEDFMKLYLGGHVKIVSYCDLNVLKSSINSLGTDKLICVLKDLKNDFLDFDEKDELLGKGKKDFII